MNAAARVVRNMPAAAYHADPALSRSGAWKILAECPAKFWHERQSGAAETKPMKLGNIAHRLVLEGKDVEDRHIIVPPGFSMSHTTKHADLIAEVKATGKGTLTKAEAETIRAMKAALLAHEFANAAFTNCETEVSLFWRDERFGVDCRARLDSRPKRGTIYTDYKTCESAEPEDLRRSIAAYGYHVQADWYCEGIRLTGLCERPTFLFLFQEKDAPYLITPVVLDQTTLDWGAALNRKAKAIFAHGLRTGQWAGYVDDIITLGLPVWATKQLEDMEALGKLAAEFQAPDNWEQAA